MPIHLDELARQDAAHVQVLGVGLEGFVVAQNLGGAGRGHGRHEQGVPETVPGDLLLEARPVPPAALRGEAPEVKLQLALARRGARVRLVGPVAGGELAGRLAGREVDCLKDVLVQPLGGLTLKGQAHGHERVCQALDAQADGPVPHVRAPRLLHWIVVPVDDPVEVLRCNLDHVVQAPEVVLLPPALRKGGQGDRREIAHSHLVRGGVLDDLRAQIGAVDGAEVLLVGLAVGVVLVQHVRRAGLHLRLQDAEPELLRLDALPALAISFHPGVHLLELLAPHVHERLASLRVIGLVGAEQRPLQVLLDAAHEEVGNPEAVEKVAGALLLLPVVLLQLEEVKDVGVPRLEVHGEGPLPLAAALVHVTRRLVEVAEHRHQPVAVAVGAADVRPLRADVGDRHPDASGGLGYERALLQGVVDAVNAVVLHGQQEAGGHLGLGRARVEQRGRRVREEAARHEVVGLDGRGHVAGVDAAGDPHQHVRRALGDLAVHPQEVRLLQSLEAKVVVVVVPLIVHRLVKLRCVALDEARDLVRDQRCWPALLVVVPMQDAGGLGERIGGVLVQVGHGDSRRKR
mmetsp:Transcript_73652/g.208598  ORF Transcript_73652/g.208598 Transcript_73652/m.208598 type:complete len:573 (-) Transcript_73652:343-2061(-)